MQQLRIVPTPRLPSSICELGRYALIELILPGGSLIALAIWAIRHRAVLADRAPRLLAIVAVVVFGLGLPGQTMADSASSSAGPAGHFLAVNLPLIYA